MVARILGSLPVLAVFLVIGLDHTRRARLVCERRTDGVFCTQIATLLHVGVQHLPPFHVLRARVEERARAKHSSDTYPVLVLWTRGSAVTVDLEDRETTVANAAVLAAMVEDAPGAPRAATYTIRDTRWWAIALGQVGAYISALVLVRAFNRRIVAHDSETDEVVVTARGAGPFARWTKRLPLAGLEPCEVTEHHGPHHHRWFDIELVHAEKTVKLEVSFGEAKAARAVADRIDAALGSWRRALRHTGNS